MYKTELIRRVARETRFNQEFVAEIMNTTLREMHAALERGERISLPGFGVFYTRLQPQGKVRHILTGKEVKIPEMRRVAFRVGEALRNAVRKRK